MLAIRAGGIDSIERAIEYYAERMQTLVRVAGKRDGDVLYMDGESLLEDTDRTLHGLSTHLGIAPALRSEYSIFRFTGVPKYGDPSTWIRSGRVVRRRAPLPAFAPERRQVQRLSQAYESMRSSASECARRDGAVHRAWCFSLPGTRKEILQVDRRTGSAAQPAE
jgi:hypothetical protein